MRVVSTSLEIAARAGAPLGALLVAPADDAPYPGLLFYTDIFGRNPASVRAMLRYASYGYTVVAPDLYRRSEPPGVALDFVRDYDRAQRDANATTVAEFDADRRLALAAMREHPRVDASRLATVGFCIGGHLALRAAVEPGMRSVVAYYPTGLHDGVLGASRGCSTLADLPGAGAASMLVFGTRDTHTDAAARARIAAALAVPPGTSAEDPSVRNRRIDEVDGAHAFMRDEGERYDPELADRVFASGLAWMRAH